MNEYPKTLYRDNSVNDYIVVFDAAEEAIQRDNGWGGLNEEKETIQDKPRRGRPPKKVE